MTVSLYLAAELTNAEHKEILDIEWGELKKRIEIQGNMIYQEEGKKLLDRTRPQLEELARQGRGSETGKLLEIPVAEMICRFKAQMAELVQEEYSELPKRINAALQEAVREKIRAQVRAQVREEIRREVREEIRREVKRAKVKK